MKFYTNVTRYFDNILVRGYNNKKPFSEKIPYRPYLFLPSKTKQSDYKTLDGKVVDKITFDSMSECNQFIKRYKDVSNFNIYGLTNFTYTYINDEYTGDIKYDINSISTVTVDIEVYSKGGFPDIEKADRFLTAITLRKNNEIVVVGLKPYKVTEKNITYYHCSSEEELIEKFVETWKRFSPDIVTGWNVEFFDIPYLVNRITRVMGEDFCKKLSPWGILESRKLFVKGREHTVYTPVGITVLDYQQLYKKFSYKMQESYSLDHISSVELGEKKLDYSEFMSLHKLYEEDFQKYIDYNINDVKLVHKLDQRLKFIEQVLTIAYSSKVNYPDTFTTVKLWDIIIHNYLISNNIVVPQSKYTEKTEQIAGGFVKDPVPGMYEWVASFDINSLYPTLIIQHNISPETLSGRIQDYFTVNDALNGYYDKIATRLKDDNLSIAANGTLYDRDRQGFLPKLMSNLYSKRSYYKDEMLKAEAKVEEIKTGKSKERLEEWENLAKQLHNYQLAFKIILNSAYGALSNAGFRYYNDDLAEAITKSGQLTILWVERALNKYINETLKTEDIDYVIAADTDSAYLNLGPLIKSICNEEKLKEIPKIITVMDKICNQAVQPIINKAFSDLADYTNANERRLKMKRENLANKAIWVAKKRYIMNVWDSEGVRYDEPELKIKGIEAVKTSTPSVCRKMIKDTIKLVMTKDEKTVQDFIKQCKNQFKTLPFQEIAFPRGCSELHKWSDARTIYAKGTPIHVKGALHYNNLVKKHKLTQYPFIEEGEKIKFCYLITPNPIRDHVVAAITVLPPEFGLNKYLDYNMQFEKTFLEPISSILDKIGWRAEKRATLSFT